MTKDTSEVVARLEQAAIHCAEQQAMHGNDIDGDSEPHWSSQLEMVEAEKACRDALALISSLVAERDEALALANYAEDISKQLDTRALTAERLLAEARAALKPFADHLDEMKFDLDNHGNELPDGQSVGWVYVTNGDFRKARAIIRASIGGGNG